MHEYIVVIDSSNLQKCDTNLRVHVHDSTFYLDSIRHCANISIWHFYAYSEYHKNVMLNVELNVSNTKSFRIVFFN
jgi:hypothetical protein